MIPIRATDNIHLRELIAEHVQHYGRECSLNHIDVSKITNFERTFQNLNFNGDISEWDVSNAFNMDSMFNYSTFDGDISSWNVSNVEQMGYMFAGSRFNQDISSWNVSKVSDMTSMFKESDFNGDISKWDVSRVRAMGNMFNSCAFQGDISSWDVSSVNYMQSMFRASVVNTDFSRWNVANSYDIRWMFYESVISQESLQSTSNWVLKSSAKMGCIFSEWNDTPLGYFGLLHGDYFFPKDDLRHQEVEALLLMVKSLNVPFLEAAHFMHQKMHEPMTGAVLDDLPYLGVEV